MSKYLMRYSVVVDGQGNPFGSAADHEQSLEFILERILKSITGRAVLRQIMANGVVRIQPYDARKYPKYGNCNALAFGATHEEKVSRALHRTAVDVHFSANSWSATSGCRKGPGSLADEILLHELVHAMRNLAQKSNQASLTGKMAGYENEEEYFAVLVTNIFTSELGRQPNWTTGARKTGLREDHMGFHDLGENMALAVDFLRDADNFRLVKKFCDQHGNFAQQIGEANARFNPIKVYYRWKSLKIEPKNGGLVRAS